MKKYLNFLLLFALCATLPACEDDIVTMDDSVDTRLDAAIKEYKNLLSESENGWLMSVQTSLGYYTFWMEFSDNGMVTMCTDNLMYPELNGVPKTSTFNIRALQRPTLSFDTYNYIHLINDPDDSISGGSGNLGLKSDFAFEFGEVTHDEIRFTGRINRVDAIMRRATAEEKAAVHNGMLMTALENAPAYKQAEKEFCMLTLNSKNVDVRLGARTVVFLWEDDAQGIRIESVNTITNPVTLDLDFTEPMTINGVTFTGLNWDATNKIFRIESAIPTAVTSRKEPAVGIQYAFGVGKYYTGLESSPEMYPSTDQSANYIGYLIEQIGGVELTFTDGSTAACEKVRLYFENDEDGNAAFVIDCPISSLTASYRYQVTFNEDGSEFTPQGNVTTNAVAEDLFGAAPFANFVNYFKGKTFRLNWSNSNYGTYSMATFTPTSGSQSAVLYGTLIHED